MMFAEADVAFEDIRVEMKEWPNIKPQMPFGQLPVLYVENIPIPQSGSIIRYLGREFGLNGRSSLETAQVDMVERRIVCAMSKIPIFEKDKAKKIKKTKEVMLSDVFPVYEKLEEMQKGNEDGFIVGDEFTYADLLVYNTMFFCKILFPDYVEEKFPKLVKLADKVSRRPRIAKWIENRPKCPF